MDSEAPSKMSRWPLLRVSVGGVSCVELLSGDWIRLSTHFSLRTFLCSDGPECPLCEILPARSLWYLPVASSPGKRASILELSSHASADLEQVVRLGCGDLRAGAVVELHRRGSRKPVCAEFVELAKAATTVSLQRWGSALMAIYGLPPFGALESLPSYGERVRSKVFERAEMISARLRAGQKV